MTVLLARYFTGILSESLLLMVIISLTMMAFGMKAADAAFIGLVMGVMNVVPMPDRSSAESSRCSSVS